MSRSNFRRDWGHWGGRDSRYRAASRSPPGRSRVQHLRNEFERERSRSRRPSSRQLTEEVQALVIDIMNLDVASEDLRAPWSRIIYLRERLVGYHNRKAGRSGVDASLQQPQAVEAEARPAIEDYKPAEAAGPMSLPHAPVSRLPNFNWIGKLQQLYSQHLKKPLEKGAIRYTTQEATGETGRDFRSVVEALTFQYAYHGDLCQTKKQAEHSAAFTAIRSEFPDFDWQEAAKAEPAAPQKPVAATQMRFKSELHEMLKALLDREITRNDMPYETSHFPDNQPEEMYVSRVTLRCYDGAGYTGKLSATRKLAEQSAAEAALSALAKQQAPEKREAWKEQKRLLRTQKRSEKARKKVAKDRTEPRMAVKDEEQSYSYSYGDSDAEDGVALPVN